MADEQGGLGEFDELSKSRAALLAQQNRLVEMLEERNRPSDFQFYANLARGFSDPNAKSFSQGLGSAVGNLQEENERQKGKELQMYQIRSQLAQSQYDLEKQNAMARQVQQAMFGSPGVGSNDALKMAAQAGLLAGPTVEAASLIGAPTQQKRIFDSLDDQTKRMIAVQARIDPAKAIDSLAKMGIEIGIKNVTKTDAQKAFEYQLGLLPESLQGSAQQAFARSQIFGKSEDTISAISNLGKALRSGEITPADAAQGLAILRNKLTPGGNQSSVSAPSSFSGSPSGNDGNQSRSVMRGTPQQVFSQLGSIEDPLIRKDATEAYLRQLDAETPLSGASPSTSQLSPLQSSELEAAKLKTRAEAEVKDVTEFRKSLNDNFKLSREREFDANTLIGLTEKSPNIFGYFNKPTVANAVTAIVQGGATILGLGVKVNELKSALLKAGATQEEINSLQRADFISIRQQLSLASQMKGAVSNFEREIVGKAVASTEDSPNVVRWKSNIVKARAYADREIFNLYQKNPNMPENKFMSLPEYREIQDRLDTRLRSNNKAYGF